MKYHDYVPGGLKTKPRSAATARSRRMRIHGARGTIRAVLSCVLVVFLAICGSAAYADPYVESRRLGYLLDGTSDGHTVTNVWMGSFDKANSEVPWFCIELGVPVTSDKKGELTERTSSAHRKAAYIIGKYGDSSSSKTHAAIALAVHELLDTTSVWDAGRSTIRGAVDGLAREGTLELSDQFIEEAQDAYGPWHLEDPTINIAADNRSGSVSKIHATSAPGKRQSVPITLTLSGDATWNATGTKTTVVDPDASGATRFTLASGGGTVAVTASYDDAPRGHAVISTPPGNSQVHTATSEPETISSHSEVQVGEWSVTPTATTVANSHARIGEALTDTIDVVLPDGQLWPKESGNAVPAVFSVSWYFSQTPLPERSAVPATQPYTTKKVTVKGEGTVTVRADRSAQQSGYYYPVVELNVNDQPNDYRQYFAADWSALLHEAREQTFVPWQPTVTTATTHPRIDVGESVADVIVVAGNEPSTALVVESTLWGPIAEPPQFVANPDHMKSAAPVPEGTPEVATVSTEVVGDATVTTEALEVVEPGYYVWTEKIAATEFTEAWHSDWASETEISRRVHQPQVTTVTSSAMVGPGETITDTLTVSGNDPDGELVITSTLYGPLPRQPELLVNAEPHNAEVILPAGQIPVVGTVTTTVMGNGTAVTPGLTVTKPGYYVWVETIPPTESSSGWAANYGQTDEVTLVAAPVSKSATVPPIETPSKTSEVPATSLANTGQSRIGPLPMLGVGFGTLGAGAVVAVIALRLARRTPVVKD